MNLKQLRSDKKLSLDNVSKMTGVSKSMLGQIECGEVNPTPLLEDNGKIPNYPIFPFDEIRRFENYAIDLDPGSYLSADPHHQGSQEFILKPMFLMPIITRAMKSLK